jgi:hypothetical protein
MRTTKRQPKEIIMKILHLVAVTATLIAGVSASYASPYNVMGGLNPIEALDTANYATVLSVNANEARSLGFDNDIASIQARIANNPYLARTVANQGYSIDQIVGIDGDDSDLTIYAL